MKFAYLQFESVVQNNFLNMPSSSTFIYNPEYTIRRGILYARRRQYEKRVVKTDKRKTHIHAEIYIYIRSQIYIAHKKKPVALFYRPFVIQRAYRRRRVNDTAPPPARVSKPVANTVKNSSWTSRGTSSEGRIFVQLLTYFQRPCSMKLPRICTEKRHRSIKCEYL